MIRDYKCPYFRNATEGKNIGCELATIRPPDTQARAEFLSSFCGSGRGYKKCPFYQILDSYYKRKFDDWEGEE